MTCRGRCPSLLGILIAVGGGACAPAEVVETIGPHGNAPLVRSVEVTPNNFTIAIGDTVRMMVTVSTERPYQVTWRVSDLAVATIDSSGLLTARGSGVAAVSATAVADGSTATGAATVFVK